MPGRRFWILAASLSLTVAAMAAEPAQVIAKLAEVMPNIVADSFSPEEGGKIVVATNAHLESKDATIDAKKIRFDYRTGTIVAEGNVVYATKNLRIIGDKIEADPRNDTIVATNVRFGRAPLYFTADTLKIVKGDKTMRGLRMWNSEPEQLGMHLRDDAKGFAYLKACGLEQGKFICVIPRLRYTPYHKFEKNRTPAPSDAIKDAINARTVEQDHVKLRDLMIAYVRKTGNKVLACPEMTYEIELSKEVLVDPLPADVKKNVVWRDTYWLPDEAASVYSQALALVSIECHSPLIALHYGTPTIHIRNPTDTCKGQMFRDIGMDDWFFEIDETDGAQLWSRLGAIHKNPTAARAKVKSIMAGVEKHQRRMVDAVREACRQK